MDNPLEGLAWVRFSLKVDSNILKQSIIKIVIVSSLFELSGMTYNTMISPCGVPKLYEGTKIIRVGYMKGDKLRFVESWEAGFPPKELVDELADVTFVIKVDYLIKGKERRKLQSDVYKVHINVYKNYINFYIRHIQGLLRTSFEEVFNIFRANFLKNLRTTIHRKLKGTQR